MMALMTLVPSAGAQLEEEKKGIQAVVSQVPVLGYDVPTPHLPINGRAIGRGNEGGSSSVAANSTANPGRLGWNPYQCAAYATTAVATDEISHNVWLQIAQKTPDDVDCTSDALFFEEEEEEEEEEACALPGIPSVLLPCSVVFPLARLPCPCALY